MVKTAVLVSGGGINLQALLDARVFGEIPECEITAVISTKPDAYALKRGEMSGIPCYIVERDLFPSQTVFSFAILDKLRDLDIELVVFAGFDCQLSQPVFKHYAGKIIDTYPSLMPAFTEGDLQGIAIQEAALSAGVKISGATAYFATEVPKKGPIILQKAVAVREDDSAEALQRRILEEGENHVLTRAVSLYCEGRLEIRGNAVAQIEPVPKVVKNRWSK